MQTEDHRNQKKDAFGVRSSDHCHRSRDLCFSAAVFRQGYGKISKVYLQDVTQQTTNNLENMIQTIEDINIQILSSAVIQEQLEIVNGQEMELYSIRNISKIVERELETNALFSSDVVSLSVISKSGLEFSVKKITGRGTDFAFPEKISMLLTGQPCGALLVRMMISASPRQYWI